MNKHDFLLSASQPDSVYESPLARVVSVDNEGLLCVSTIIKNFEEEEFKW